MASPNKLVLAVGGVAILAAAGWYGWQRFVESGPAPAATVVPTPKPKRPVSAPKPTAPSAQAQAGPAAPAAAAQASMPADPDQLIGEALIVTGLGQQLDRVPEQLAAGMQQGVANRQVPPALAREIGRISAESFTAQGFHRRVREALKANYDEKRLRALVSDASTPVVKKMTRFELAEPSQTELAAYFSSLASNPIPAERQALLERLDEASNASGLGTEIALTSLRAMAVGAAGGNPNAVAEIDRAMEGQRSVVLANIRQSSLPLMAFTYRDATDAELTEYIKLYESDQGKWFMHIVSAALVEEFKSASGQFGEKIAALAKSQQARTASATEAESGSAPAGGGQRTAAQRLSRTYPSKDLRSCLDLATAVEVIKCAEQGR